jgi:quinol monooxygenase YgiN
VAQNPGIKSNFVSLHPYFKAHPGKLDAFKEMLPRFLEKTATETSCLFYEFGINGDELFCREAYENAAGLLEHLDNVGELLAEAMKIADLTRIEIHGPAAELEKLKQPLANMNPAWFALEKK